MRREGITSFARGTKKERCPTETNRLTERALLPKETRAPYLIAIDRDESLGATAQRAVAGRTTGRLRDYREIRTRNKVRPAASRRARSHPFVLSASRCPRRRRIEYSGAGACSLARSQVKRDTGRQKGESLNTPVGPARSGQPVEKHTQVIRRRVDRVRVSTPGSIQRDLRSALLPSEEAARDRRRKRERAEEKNEVAGGRKGMRLNKHVLQERRSA